MSQFRRNFYKRKSHHFWKFPFFFTIRIQIERILQGIFHQMNHTDPNFQTEIGHRVFAYRFVVDGYRIWIFIVLYTVAVKITSIFRYSYNGFYPFVWFLFFFEALYLLHRNNHWFCFRRWMEIRLYVNSY